MNITWIELWCFTKPKEEVKVINFDQKISWYGFTIFILKDFDFLKQLYVIYHSCKLSFPNMFLQVENEHMYANPVNLGGFVC